MANATAQTTALSAGSTWMIELSRLGRAWTGLAGRDTVPGYGRDLPQILAKVDEIAGNDAPRSGWGRLRSTSAVASLVAGTVLTVAGGAMLLLAFPEFGVLALAAKYTGDAGVLLAILGLPVLVAGATLLRRAEQMMQTTVTEARSDDPRPPILFLRSFLDDDTQLPEPDVGLYGEKEPRRVGFEISIADQLRRFGPLIAIGKPGEGLSRLGASRQYFSDDEWQAAIHRWMDESRLVVVMVGLTRGVTWEIAQLLARGHMGKVIFVFPPRGEAYDGIGTEARARRLAIIRQSLEATPVGAILGQVPFERLIALHMRGGGIVAMHSHDESEFDYELAIELAAYGLLGDETPEPAPNQTSKTPERLFAPLPVA
jgi:hypothetical protein